jgi:RsiW-degrading membrane proteinase PrsW (M82 family)
MIALVREQIDDHSLPQNIVMTTALVLAVAIPMIKDLKGTKVHPAILIIITLIFAIPLAFLSYIWLPDPNGSWLAIFFLITVLLLIVLLVIAR